MPKNYILVPVAILLLLINTPGFASKASATIAAPENVGKGEGGRVIVNMFWGELCADCEEEKQFLADLKRKYTYLDVREYEVLRNERNLALLTDLMKSFDRQASGVPVTFIGDMVIEGFSKQQEQVIKRKINNCRAEPCGDPVARLQQKGQVRDMQRPVRLESAPVEAEHGMGRTINLPFFGTLDLHTTSLPVLTLVISSMDSFNPCAFFVLMSLLGLLVHAQSRSKIFLVGGVFVFFSGFINLLAMAAWLNLFLVMGNSFYITTGAGVVSLFIASVNIKDFFAFKKGFSLSVPDATKPRLYERMRNLLRSTSFFSILAGTASLAIMANLYELLCTSGFPMVFTRALTLNHPSTFSSYLYLFFYNVVRVIPLFVIVMLFTITLGTRKLTERQGRALKLVSGIMMLGLSFILLFNPALLNSLMISLSLMAGAIGLSIVLITVTKKRGYY